jgi:hypothetical protein
MGICKSGNLLVRLAVKAPTGCTRSRAAGTCPSSWRPPSSTRSCAASSRRKRLAPGPHGSSESGRALEPLRLVTRTSTPAFAAAPGARGRRSRWA